MAIKITNTMRRMVRDAEFANAVKMLIEAQDALRLIEYRNRSARRSIDPTDYRSLPKARPSLIKQGG